MKKLILDFSKWRCGDNGENQLGSGETALLNDEGFMCCLGQFSPQINPEVTNKMMLGQGEPGDLPAIVQDLFYGNGRNISHRSTSLTFDAINVNDDKDTTPQQKINCLKEIFLAEGYEIEVINETT